MVVTAARKACEARLYFQADREAPIPWRRQPVLQPESYGRGLRDGQVTIFPERLTTSLPGLWKSQELTLIRACTICGQST